MRPAVREIDEAEIRLGRRFPADYREYLGAHGAGPIVDTPELYVELWTIDDLMVVNELPEARGPFPDLLRFGGDGSREQLAFDFRTEPPRVVLLDVTAGSDEDLVEQGGSFSEFLANLSSRGLAFEV
jgi:cell wall assembly regulator SMI1